jgi:calcineurin-like phosphoesterase family protein
VRALKYYISDTHFEHNSIINFDQRPFGSVAEMRESMIDKWNEIVTDEDEVYILGDFCFSKRAENWTNILKALKGKKYLIKGNHDILKNNGWEEVKNYFEGIYDYLEVKDNGRLVMLSHYPMLHFKQDYLDNTYMLYGHVHYTEEYLSMAQAVVTTKKFLGKYYNAHCFNCWCGLYQWAPATLDEVIAAGERTDRLIKEMYF